jgi:hypothetical protein
VAYNFPDTPTVGQVFQAWTWNGEAWVLTLPLNVEYVLKSGDTMTGHLGLPTDPAADQAVRRDYVDTGLAAVDLASKVSKTGDTMTGHLALPTGPAAANAVRKDYVDAADTAVTTNANSRVLRAGDSMTGKLQTNTDTKNIAVGGGHDTIEVFAQSGAQAAISFHNIGAFATNLGMANDGNFYMGGWSHGAIAYRFWTTRDFNYTPQANLGFTPVQQSGGAYQLGNKIYLGWDNAGLRLQVDGSDQGKIRTEGNTITGGRLVHAGDASDYSGNVYEPYAGAVISGLAVGRFPDARVALVYGRYRYMQLCTTSWFTIAYA